MLHNFVWNKTYCSKKLQITKINVNTNKNYLTYVIFYKNAQKQYDGFPQIIVQPEQGDLFP